MDVSGGKGMQETVSTPEQDDVQIPKGQGWRIAAATVFAGLCLMPAARYIDDILLAFETDDVEMTSLGVNLVNRAEPWPLPPKTADLELKEVIIHRDGRLGFIAPKTSVHFEFEAGDNRELELAFAVMQRTAERMSGTTTGHALLKNDAGQILAHHEFPIKANDLNNRNWYEKPISLKGFSGQKLQLSLKVDGPGGFGEASDPHEIGFAWQAPRLSVAPEPTRPNVLLISLDTLRADRLNAYGYEDRETSPHLSLLAENGLICDSAIANAPWTSPSHMAMISGRYPSTYRVRFQGEIEGNSPLALFSILDPAAPTLATTLKAQGYRTAAFVGGGYVGSALGFSRGFERFAERLMKVEAPFSEEPLEWLHQHQDEPFFLFVHTFEVHAAYTRTNFVQQVAGETGLAKVEGILDTLRESKVYPGERTVAVSTSRLMKRLLKKDGIYNRELSSALYDGGILAADAYVGQIIKTLEALDLKDNTIVIVTSDHGEEFGDHNSNRFYNAHNHQLYEEMLRVPLIIHWPEGIAPGSQLKMPVQSVDIVPTVYEALALADVEHVVDGKSLLTYLREGEDAERVVYSEAPLNRLQRAARTAQHKYIYQLDASMMGRLEAPWSQYPAENEELYDLQTDNLEKNNVAAVHPHLTQKYKTAVDSTLEDAYNQRFTQPSNQGNNDELLRQELRALGYQE